ncbi:hypothetical protein SAMN05421743_12242 [Thalassobacillus cyri]|uniref:Uncharacterized protein n=1 Tax=Thalassobacillus cyri TaxID=571932 RepID=A0A1H4H681_9BACI|nr:hypothetical protein SAMN05421743_12242 [Thalassobacillus cyri]
MRDSSKMLRIFFVRYLFKNLIQGPMGLKYMVRSHRALAFTWNEYYSLSIDERYSLFIFYIFFDEPLDFVHLESFAVQSPFHFLLQLEAFCFPFIFT